jgi:hypothetical protein
VGNPDLSELRTAHLERVRAYCGELCPPERVQEAAEATFLDLAARMSASAAECRPEELLLRAARSAAAARLRVEVPSGHPLRPECEVMPELLAARANGELAGDERPIRAHVTACLVCETTLARLRRAEQRLAPLAWASPPPALTGAPPPALTGARAPEVARAIDAQPEPQPAPLPAQPAPPPAPGPQRPVPAAQPIVIRRRTGGLVGALRKAASRARR